MMLASSAIQEVWKEKVFCNSEILSLTNVLIEHEIVEDSHKEISSLRYETKINFFGFRVLRALEVLNMGKYRLRFFVDVSYTKWADPEGHNYNDVRDGIEKIQEVVFTELGSTWNGLLASAQPQETPPSISVITIGKESAFKADYSYSGFICNV